MISSRLRTQSLLFRLILSLILLVALNGKATTAIVPGVTATWAAFSSQEKDELLPLLTEAAGGLSDSQLQLAEEMLEQAEAAANLPVVAAIEYALCQAYFARQQLDRALVSAIRGRDAARTLRNRFLAALCNFGIARIHQLAGDYANGEKAGLAALLDASRARYRTIEIRSVLAGLQSLLQKTGQAELQFHLALREARSLDKDKDQDRIVASIEELYGLNLLRWNRAEEGHRAIVRSWQLRQEFSPNELPFSFRSLARSELARGHYLESIAWADKALASPTPGLSTNLILYEKSVALERLGRDHEALAAVREAVAATRRLRLFFPLGDAIQMGMERHVQNIYSQYADLASSLALRAKDPTLVREAFEAAQDNRAWSLRARVASGMEWRRRLPPEYWTKLNELRRLEVQQADPEQVHALQAELSDFETVAGVRASGEMGETPSDFSGLDHDEILIAFHFTGKSAIRWAVTRAGMRIDRLENAPEIQVLAEKFHAFPDDAQLARTLFTVLFGDVLDSLPFQAITLVPDQILFQVPFPALRTPIDRGNRYLAQQYRLRLVPAANFTAHPGIHARQKGRGILALGDPISNRADPRWSGHSGWNPNSTALIELPRLAGSQREVERCSRAWEEPRLSLTGPEITVDSFRNALQRNPQVVHFATHVYQPPDPAVPPVLTLGLSPESEPITLNSASIAVLPVAPPVVTLSGCGSGRGPLAPGTGLLGLTRAWLMAGSLAVVASLWPVMDDSGDFFEEYYRNLMGNKNALTPRNVAQALRNAQVKMIQEGGWRASPRYWGAYFVIGAL